MEYLKIFPLVLPVCFYGVKIILIMTNNNDVNVDVVVCTYKMRKDDAVSCVISLKEQRFQPKKIVLVVDSETEKNFYSSIPELRNSLINVIASKRSGLSAARNCGIRNCNCDIVTFIDDDAVADKNWLYEIVETFKDKNIVVVGGQVKPIFSGKRIKESFNWLVGCTDKMNTRPIGCNMAIRKEILEEVGVFNENLGRVKNRLLIGEETDLFLRIKKYKPKAKVIFNPRAVVYHNISKDRTKIKFILKRSFYEGFGKFMIGKKYGLDTEKSYLKSYLKKLDLFTLIVLLAVACGYMKGFITTKMKYSSDLEEYL